MQNLLNPIILHPINIDLPRTSIIFGNSCSTRQSTLTLRSETRSKSNSTCTRCYNKACNRFRNTRVCAKKLQDQIQRLEKCDICSVSLNCNLRQQNGKLQSVFHLYEKPCRQQNKVLFVQWYLELSSFAKRTAFSAGAEILANAFFWVKVVSPPLIRAFHQAFTNA